MAEQPAGAQPAGFEVPADLLANTAWLAAEPALVSVVVPFLSYDVQPLACRLLQLAESVAVPVPLIFVQRQLARFRLREQQQRPGDAG